MAIKFDLDGTLIDLIEITDRFLEKEGYTRRRPQLQYEIETNPWNIKKSRLWDIFFRVYDHWRETKLMFGAEDLVREIWERTAEPIQVITARPYEGAMSAHCICNRIFGDIPHTIAIVKSGSDKYLHMSDNDILVEDRRRTCLELAKKGLRSIIINTEYNQIENEDQIPEILARVKSPGHLISMLDVLLY